MHRGCWKGHEFTNCMNVEPARDTRSAKGHYFSGQLIRLFLNDRRFYCPQSWFSDSGIRLSREIKLLSKSRSRYCLGFNVSRSLSLQGKKLNNPAITSYATWFSFDTIFVQGREQKAGYWGHFRLSSGLLKKAEDDVTIRGSCGRYNCDKARTKYHEGKTSPPDDEAQWAPESSIFVTITQNVWFKFSVLFWWLRLL